MSRFFLNQRVTSDIIEIIGDDVAHIRKVLRMKKGDAITVCDNAGGIFLCSIMEINEASVKAKIEQEAAESSEPNLRVTLLQGIPKGDKMDLIIQKCTELGIACVVPVLMERTVVKLNDKKSTEKKVQRWQRIALEAAKQSGRAVVPEIKEPVTFEEALGIMDENEYKMIPYENQENYSIKQYLKDISFKEGSFAYMIGPEGGFSAKEIELIDEREIKRVSLGKRILRTETAGFATLVAVMYEFGEMDG